jgi:hypothetical protein
MLKLTVGVLAFVLAGSASAAGWRSLRIDASSEDSFNESVIAFREKLPFVRRQVFERSLQDIWVEGTKAAQADGRDYTVTDYLRALDGLKYKEVVLFTDPSGATADRYWDQAFVTLNRTRMPPPGRMSIPGPSPGVQTFSGSKILDAGQSFRAEGRIGGTHH